MQISTKVFNEQALGQFARATNEIQETQAKISTGKNLLRASDDPVAAANISAAKDQLQLINRYHKNIDRVTTRLELAEIAVSEMQNIMTRLYELTIQAKNDTYSAADREAIAVESRTLKGMLVALANRQDINGDAIFAGYETNNTPFITEEDGSISFVGDHGTHMLQISETQTAATTVNGANAFMRIKTEGGFKDMFSIVDGLLNGMEDISNNTSIIGEIKDVMSHLSNVVTAIGSQINIAGLQAESIEKRKLLVSSDLSKIEDADLTELVTKLQSLLVNRDAAQQSFALIGQQSLFDFIR